MKCGVFGVVALAGLAAGAFGQGAASWVLLAGSGTFDGDFVIDHSIGEYDITFVLGMDLKPSPGETLGDGSLVVGFGSVIANIIGTENWETGYATWTMNPDLIFLTGDLTHIDDKTQDLYDINAGQIPGFGPFSSADPIWVMTVNWRTTDFVPRDVTADVDTQDRDTIQAYIKTPGGSFEEPQTWPAPDGLLSFKVTTIPAPGVPGVAMLLGALGASPAQVRWADGETVMG